MSRSAYSLRQWKKCLEFNNELNLEAAPQTPISDLAELRVQLQIEGVRVN